jgi:UPF0755 protein
MAKPNGGDRPERRANVPQPTSPAVKAEPTRPPARPRGRKSAVGTGRISPFVRVLNNFLTLSVVLLMCLGMLGVWYAHEVDRLGPLTEPKGFAVKRGDGVREIAARLEQDGAIGSQHIFIAHCIGRYLASFAGAKPLNLKAGEYEIQPQASLREIVEVLGEGKSVLSRITIPEGLTTFQIVERVKANQSLTGDVVAMPAEGVLLPDTYKFARGMTRQALIDTMASEGRKFLDQAWATRQQGLPLKTPEEALVLASIVEKETGKNDERERVAAVFVNRLKQGMKLQSDPTILYGLFGPQTQWGRPIYKTEIAQKTAHNTYQIDGLPPTPIANAGRAAIQAVLNPATTTDLFFVADGRGGHVFTSTLKDHNAAVANWRKIEKEMRAREAAKAAAKAAAKGGVEPVKAGAGVLSPGPGVRAEEPGEEAPPPTLVPVQTVPVQSISIPVPPQPAQTALKEQPPAAEAAAGVPLPTRKPKR